LESIKTVKKREIIIHGTAGELIVRRIEHQPIVQLEVAAILGNGDVRCMDG
jgi:hypothetical protein